MYMVAFEKKHPPRPDTGIDDDIWEVLVACWTSNPDQRPSITRVRDDLGALINSELVSFHVIAHTHPHGA